MVVTILLPFDNSPHGYYDEAIEADRFCYRVVGGSVWGRHEYMIVGGHNDYSSSDVIVAHSGFFEFDILRMLRFILYARSRAPWIVYVLLLSPQERRELASYPAEISDCFSKYFQVVKDQFSLDDVLAYLSKDFDRIAALVAEKRHQGRLTQDNVGPSSLRGLNKPRFDFALSFAGAQRREARDLARALKGRGCAVFFDEDETSSLLGTNLGEKLYEVYNEQSTFCVMFVSKEYRDGPWTNHERRAALDRAVEHFKTPYILPIRVDQTDLPGLSRSVVYLKWIVGIEEITRVLNEKLLIKMLSDG